MDDENKNGNGKDDQEQQVEMPDTEDLNVGELERSDRFLPERIHILPLNDRPLFPGTVYPISGSDANFARTISAVESTQHNTLGFVLKKEQARDADEDEPISFTDIYKIGVAGRILKSAEDEDGQFHVLVQLISRMEIVDFYRDSGVYMATVTYPKLEADVQTQDIRAHTIALIQAIKELVKHNPLPQEQIAPS
ncbi:MAG: LON peptidase substrate-binding domain-containing protein [Planctomycetota bacterium]|nr:LON peptidase substrate-binding domain-containing protein [Planctomycetota bacterium]